jgi:hypothetical protein
MRLGMSRAFLEAMHKPDVGGQPTVELPEPVTPTCDRSGDAGSKHVWPDGSVVGDWCLCGKRKRFPRVSVQAHTHVCEACGKPFECPGTLERNVGGWPEVVCFEFHRMEQRFCPTCSGADDEAEA